MYQPPDKKFPLLIAVITIIYVFQNFTIKMEEIHRFRTWRRQKMGRNEPSRSSIPSSRSNDLLIRLADHSSVLAAFPFPFLIGTVTPPTVVVVLPFITVLLLVQEYLKLSILLKIKGKWLPVDCFPYLGAEIFESGKERQIFRELDSTGIDVEHADIRLEQTLGNRLLVTPTHYIRDLGRKIFS